MASSHALETLVDQVRHARADKQRLCIRGGGSKDFYGGALQGEVLDTRKLAGISAYEPSELVVTVRAGTPLAELEAAAQSVPGAWLLHSTADPSHNRSVYSIAGTADALLDVILAITRVAIARIDLRAQRGAHPRIGAVDVVPFIPLANTPMAACICRATTRVRPAWQCGSIEPWQVSWRDGPHDGGRRGHQRLVTVMPLASWSQVVAVLPSSRSWYLSTRPCGFLGIESRNSM